MTFLEHIYKESKQHNIVNNSEDFSERLLNKSPSYYRTLKAQKRDANTDLLIGLLSNITIQRNTHRIHGSNHPVITQWLDKWESIEEQIAEEVAVRTTNKKAISTDGLKSIIKALQREEQKRASKLLH